MAVEATIRLTVIPHTYPARLVRVVDGDTIDLLIDVGFRMSSVQRVRLLDYNAPESTGPERTLGERATQALRAMLGEPGEVPLVVTTFKGDAFGRWLAHVSLPDGTDIVPALVAAGYGVPWDGRGARPAFHPAAPYPLVASQP